MKRIGTRVTAFCLGILMAFFSSGITVLADTSTVLPAMDSGATQPVDSGSPTPEEDEDVILIDRFEPLTEEEAHRLVLPGTELQTLRFPDTLTAYADGARLTVPVAWACPDYEPSAEPGAFFTVKPVLPGEYTTAEGTELPVIFVLFSEAVPLIINDRIIVEEVIYKEINPDEVQLIGVTERFAGGNLVIPGTVADENGKRYTVSSIEYGAFQNCTTLTGVTIPDSVTKIADYAFSGCKALAELNLSDGLKTVGNCAFADTSALAAITVPNDVQFSSYAFARSGVASVAFETGNLHPGIYMFEGCPNLKEITIPANLPQGGMLFQNSALETVAFAEDVTEVADNAFYNCRKLKTVQFPVAQGSGGGGLTRIRSSAFEYCTSLASIEIPDTVSVLGAAAFQSCTSLTSITLPASAQELPYKFFYNCTALTSVKIPSNFRNIQTEAFRDCRSLKTVEIEEGLQTIGINAFMSCASLDSIELPDSVTWLYNGVFQESGLQSIRLSANLSSIPFATFSGCKKLVSVEIPDKVTTLEQYAFQYSGLTSISLPDSVTSIGISCFALTPLVTVKLSEKLTQIGANAFEDCNQLTEVSIPESVTMLAEKAFANCTKLTSIRILGSMRPALGEQASTIGRDAFAGINDRAGALIYVKDEESVKAVFESNVIAEKIRYLDGNDTGFVPFIVDGVTYEVMDEATLTARVKNAQRVSGAVAVPEKVTEPQSGKSYTVTEIDGNAFRGNLALTALTIADTVTSIQPSAFVGCAALETVVLPAALTIIPYNAFGNCRELKTVNIPNGVKTIGGHAFNGSRITEVTLPEGIEGIGNYAFQSSQLAKINLPEGLKTIGDYAFSSALLQSVTTPQSLESMGERAFANNTALTDVTIQGNPRLGNGAFRSCSSLTKAVLPDNLPSLPYELFEYCSKLSEVKMPLQCSSIESYAFWGCNSLQSIELPENLTNISSYAFQNTALKEIVIPDSVTSIATQAFMNCTALKAVILPPQLGYLGDGAFAYCNSLASVTFRSEGRLSVGASCFAGCPLLQAIALPKGLDSISYGMFEGCSGLETVTIAEGPTWVGPRAFTNCKVTSLTLPGTVQSIGESAFYEMGNLGSVKILGNRLTSIGRNAFPPGVKLIANDPRVQLLLVEYLNQTERPATTWDGKSDIPAGAVVTLEADTEITSALSVGREAELTVLLGVTLTIKGAVKLEPGSTIKVQSTGRVLVAKGGSVTGNNVEELPLQYQLMVETDANGTATVGKPFYFGGEAARITTQPASGYGMRSLLVNGNAVQTDTENLYEFPMPYQCSTAKASFDQIANLVGIRGPEHAKLAEGATAEYSATLPAGLEAERVKCTWSAEPANAVSITAFGNSVTVQAAALGRRETPVTLTLSVMVGSSQYAVKTDLSVLQGAIKSISLLPSDGITLGLGHSQQMTLKTVPENYEAIFFWTSSAPKSVAVEQNGMVTAVAPGSAKIRAAVSGVSSNEVSVQAKSTVVYATGIELSAYDVTLRRGGTAAVSAKLLPANVTVRGGWSSADTGIATVDAVGTIRGLRPGKTIVSYSIESGPQSLLKKDIQVTVTEETVASIAILEKPDRCRVGTSLRLTVRFTPDNAANKQVKWSSSKPAIASVDANGLVTVHGAGTAEITAVSVAAPNARTSVKIIGAVDTTGKLAFQGGGKAAYKNIALSGQGVLPASSYTDESGAFRFDLLTVGTYALVSEPYVAGYNRMQTVMTIAEGADKAVWSLEYPKCETGSITLRFLDTQGKPVPGVRASVQCVGPYFYQAGFSADNGALAFQSLSCDDRGVAYQINYSTADGAFGEKTVELKATEPGMTLDFVVPSVATVSGKVVDTRGVGVSGVYVSLDKFGAYTNANGTYAIRGAIAVGSYPLRLSEKEIYYPLKEQAVNVTGGNVQVPDYVVSRGISVSARLLLNGGTDTYKKAYVSLYDEKNALIAGGYASGTDGYGFDGAIKKPGTYYVKVVNIFDKDGYQTIRFEAEPVRFQVTSMEQDRVAVQLEAMTRLHPSEVFSGDGNALATNVQLVQRGGKFDVVGRYRNNSSQRVTAVFHTELLNAAADSAHSGTEYAGKDFTVTLEPGGEGRFLIKALAAEEAIFAASVQTSVTLNGETFDFGRCGVEVVGVSLEARSTSVGLNQPVWVYGEATPGSALRIYDIEGSLLASTRLEQGMGRWFTAELKGFATEGVHQIYALADYNTEVANSEKLTFVVSAKPVEVERVTVDQLSYEDLPINPRIDVRTFSHALDAAMRPSPLTVRTTLSNSDIIKELTYKFAEHSFPATRDANGRWTANLENWRGTGIKRLTAEITTSDGRSFHLVIAEVTVLIDPSGAITDADTGMPLAGALATCYQYQKAGSTWNVWDGAPHGMVNPWVTGEDGRYGWDVETGLYRVSVEKDGYEQGVSSSIEKYREGIQVPPPALDVNLALVPTTKMRLVELEADDQSVTAQFSRYVRSVSAHMTGPEGDTITPRVAISGDTVVLTSAELRPNTEYMVQFEAVLPHSGTKAEYRIESLTETIKTAPAAGVSGSSTKSTLVFPFSSLNITEEAIKRAPREGSSVIITMNGNPSATGEELSKALSALNPGEKLQLRRMSGKAVSYQLTIDPSKLTTLPSKLEFGAELEDQAVEQLFEKYYPGSFAAIRLAQNGEFGFTAEFAARIDLTGLDKSRLRVYRYDAKQNQYTLLRNARPWVDANGYLHMQLSAGGSLVLTDRLIGG